MPAPQGSTGETATVVPIPKVQRATSADGVPTIEEPDPPKAPAEREDQPSLVLTMAMNDVPTEQPPEVPKEGGERDDEAPIHIGMPQ